MRSVILDVVKQFDNTNPNLVLSKFSTTYKIKRAFVRANLTRTKRRKFNPYLFTVLSTKAILRWCSGGAGLYAWSTASAEKAYASTAAVLQLLENLMLKNE